MTLIVSIIASGGCGIIIGMLAGKLLTEREMQDNLEQHGNNVRVESYSEGYKDGYNDRGLELKRRRQ